MENGWLVDGLEHFLFSHILGIITPHDIHIFQLKPPTRWKWTISKWSIFHAMFDDTGAARPWAPSALSAQLVAPPWGGLWSFHQRKPWDFSGERWTWDVPPAFLEIEKNEKNWIVQAKFELSPEKSEIRLWLKGIEPESWNPEEIDPICRMGLKWDAKCWVLAAKRGGRLWWAQQFLSYRGYRGSGFHMFSYSHFLSDSVNRITHVLMTYERCGFSMG